LLIGKIVVAVRSLSIFIYGEQSFFLQLIELKRTQLEQPLQHIAQASVVLITIGFLKSATIRQKFARLLFVKVPNRSHECS